MFSKSRINETARRSEAQRAAEAQKTPSAPSSATASRASLDLGASGATSAPKPKPAASSLSSDLQITGNLRTSGDIVIEAVVDGDIHAHLLTVGESATIRGEIVADDIVINGRVIGRVRGLKVRLTSTARVEGDIIHKTIAIESGAHFEGSVQRQENPLASGPQSAQRPAAIASPSPSPAAQTPVQASAQNPAQNPAQTSGPTTAGGYAPRPGAPKPPQDNSRKSAQ